MVTQDKGDVLNLSLQYKVKTSGLFSLARIFGAQLFGSPQVEPDIIEKLFSRPSAYKNVSVYGKHRTAPERYEVGSVRNYYVNSN